MLAATPSQHFADRNSQPPNSQPPSPARGRCLLALVTVVCVALPAAPAAAGGWWSSIDLDRPYVAVGETFVVRGEAFFRTIEEAEAAEPYFAYLVSGYDRQLLRRAMTKPDPRRWWAVDDDALVVRVGAVDLVGMQGNYGTARASITIPRMRPGRYHLMLCTEGCAKPLGSSTIPTSLRVVNDPAVARIAAHTTRLERRVASLQQRLATHKAKVTGPIRLEVQSLRTKADYAEKRADAAVYEAGDLQHRMDALADHVAELEAAQDRTIPAGAWLALAGLALLAGAVLARRRRHAPGPRNKETPGGADEHEWERPDRLVGSGAP